MGACNNIKTKPYVQKISKKTIISETNNTNPDPEESNKIIKIEANNTIPGLDESNKISKIEANNPVLDPEESNKEFISAEYYWYWKSNKDPFDKSVESIWAPYDIWISNFIEENYQKKITIFDVEIGNYIYSINLKKNCQFLKAEPNRCRFITRASKNEKIRILRKNRFTNLNEALVPLNDSINYHYYMQNVQVKLKVCELFGDPKKEKGFMFDAKNTMFSREICISRVIHDELKKQFYDKIKFNNIDEVMNFIKQEIRNEAGRYIMLNNKGEKVNTLEKISKVHHIKHAEKYIQYLDRKKNLTFEEKMLFLYTLEGFVVYSINSVLRDILTFNSMLFLYFTLLQASISIVSQKYRNKHASKSIKKINGDEYYELYRGAKVTKKFLLEDKELADKNKGTFKVFNEFLSTSYDERVAMDFLYVDDLKEGVERVKYRFLVKKEIADKIPNLMCFIEDISNHSSEKEVLLSSSTIFQVQDIRKHSSHYDVTLIFISNGFNKFDFLKYCYGEHIQISNGIGVEGALAIAEALKANKFIKIQLSWDEIGDEEAIVIAEALKTNTSLRIIMLFSNLIGVEGAKAFGGALKLNTSLQRIHLGNNKIGDEGAKAIGEALKFNTSLQFIILFSNQIGVEGGKAFGGALKFNTSLEKIVLDQNKIGDEGAKAIGEALKTNTSLHFITLYSNQIGNDGAKAIGEALKTNTSIREVNLFANNQIEYEVEKMLNKHKNISFSNTSEVRRDLDQ